MGRFRPHHHCEPNGGMNEKLDTYATVQNCLGSVRFFMFLSLKLTKAAFMCIYLSAFI